LFNKILSMTGAVSPIEIAEAPKAPTAPPAEAIPADALGAINQ